MKHCLFSLLASATVVLSAGAAQAQQVDLGGRPMIQATSELKNGEFIWAPELSRDGPILMVVNIATQRAILFRNGVPIAATTVSTGKSGNDTPTGVFTVLEKKKEHYSKTYNNAPMPNMQRLTWKGVALHAGKLPGYPASHGCIRLPPQFSSLLFGATHLGMTVVITSVPTIPSRSAPPDLALARSPAGQGSLVRAAYEWTPERSKNGMVSVIVSVADQRAIVMRGGVQIGSAPVRVNMPVERAMAYVVRSWGKEGPQWLKLQFGGAGQGIDVAADEVERFETPWEFRRAVASSMKLGSVIIVTPESLSTGSPGREQTVIDDNPESS
jgi:hypothetical protein